MKKHTHHRLIYVLEFIIVGGGFALILTYPMKFMSQVLVLAGMLLIYMTLGLLHHRNHHDIKAKIVLEYILVSALVFAIFIFVNITRI